MATVDARIAELVEALISSGADWLAFEILSEIRLGQSERHLKEEFEQARTELSAFRRDERSAPPRIQARIDSVRHLEGEQKVRFAVAHVLDRLSQNIDMAELSLSNLGRIVSGNSEDSNFVRSKTLDVGMAWTDIEGRLTRSETNDARSKLSILRQTLSDWLESATIGETPS